MSMFGWFKRKPVEPIGPALLHRWYVDVADVWDGANYERQYEVIRHSWDPIEGDWHNERTLARFDSEAEAQDFIGKHGHLPQAFDIVKTYTPTKGTE
jgi:hypothetical protein